MLHRGRVPFDPLSAVALLLGSVGVAEVSQARGLRCYVCPHVQPVVPSNSRKALLRASKAFDEHLATHGIVRAAVARRGTHWGKDRFGREHDAQRAESRR